MWYTVVLLFTSTETIDPPRAPLWEEDIILLRGSDEHEIREKAEAYASKQETEYVNANGNLLTVRFDRIALIYKIDDDEPQDGSELLSRFFRDSEVKSMLQPFDDE